MKDYNPSLLNAYKFDKINRNIAGDLIGYVNDLRTLGFTLEEAWEIARQVASRLQYLGVQDAGKKRRITTGPWAGRIYCTDNGKITKTVTKEKWSKGRKLLLEIKQERLKNPEVLFSYKRLERICGFLCHLSMFFDMFTPYLKGFHLTLAQHLPKRDDEGWKMSDNVW